MSAYDQQIVIDFEFTTTGYEAFKAGLGHEITAKMMGDLMSGDYRKLKSELEAAVPLRKKGQASVLSSSIGAACAGLAELKEAFLAGEQRAVCVSAA